MLLIDFVNLTTLIGNGNLKIGQLGRLKQSLNLQLNSFQSCINNYLNLILNIYLQSLPCNIKNHAIRQGYHCSTLFYYCVIEVLNSD